MIFSSLLIASLKDGTLFLMILPLLCHERVHDFLHRFSQIVRISSVPMDDIVLDSVRVVMLSWVTGSTSIVVDSIKDGSLCCKKSDSGLPRDIVRQGVDDTPKRL